MKTHTPYPKYFVLSVILVLLPLKSFADRNFFIDVNSQASSEDGNGQTPWKSFEAAKAGLQSELATQSEDFIVNVKAGTYVIDEDLVFTGADSGNGSYSVTYKPHGGANVLITGSEEVSGTWVSQGSNIWSLSGQTSDYHVVFVDGEIQYKARHPNWDPNDSEINYMQVGSYVNNTSFTHRSADEATFDLITSRADLEVVAWHSLNNGSNSKNNKWWPYRFKVNSLNDSNNTVTCDDFGTTSLRSGADYFVQGSLGFLDAEGEFYLDTVGNVLYLYSTTNPGSREVRFPANSSSSLFKFEGTETELARNIVFEGFEVAYTDRGGVPFSISGNVENIIISGCHIHGVAAASIKITGASTYCSVYDNYINDAGGITISGPDASVVGEIPNGYHMFRNNRLSHIGWLMPEQDIRGFNVNNSGANEVSHNRIDDVVATAIRVAGKGWRANYSTLQEGIDWLPARDNVVNFNEVTNFSETCQDLGGLNMNAINEGTLLENNIVRDKTMRKLGTTSWQLSHSLGIYSARDNLGSTVRNNLVYDMKSNSDGPIPYAVRVAGNKPIVENNIIADNVIDRGGSEEAVIQVRSPLAGELSNNILAGNTLRNSNAVTYLAVTSWEKEPNGTNDNWDGNGTEIAVAEFNYSDDPLSISSNYSGLNNYYGGQTAWFNATGLEEFSVQNQQPGFMNAASHDYRPRYDSNIWRLTEFESIDMQNIGLEANHPYSSSSPVIEKVYLKEQGAVTNLSWVESVPGGAVQTLVSMARDVDGFVIDPNDYFGGPTYSSSNTSVANVSSGGVVTAVGYGVAEISVEIATSSSQSASSSMHMVVQKLAIDSSPTQLTAGGNANVTVRFNLQGVTADRDIQCRLVHKSSGLVYGSLWKTVTDDISTPNDETVNFSAPGGSWGERIGYLDVDAFL